MKDKRLNNIVDIIVRETNPSRIILFGSRAKGSHRFNSDYDLLIDANKIDVSKRRRINDFLEKVLGLYKVDLVFAADVELSFINLILKNGKVIYERWGSLLIW